MSTLNYYKLIIEKFEIRKKLNPWCREGNYNLEFIHKFLFLFEMLLKEVRSNFQGMDDVRLWEERNI